MDFDSLAILELAPSVLEETRSWFINQLRSSKENGGADLIVKCIESVVHSGSFLLHISASNEHLLRGAEEVGLRKKKLDGSFDFFLSQSKDLFEDLNQNDILLIIKHDLDNLRAVKHETIPGLQSVKPLYPGKSIIRRLYSAGVLSQCFPLHDQEYLKPLKQKMLFHVPFLTETAPLLDIRNYFGDTIAMYFAFLKYFAWALLPVVIVAIPYYLFGGRNDFESFLFFAIYNLIWATLLIEIWKRKSATIAFGWGTLSLQSIVYEEPRAGFHGPLEIHPVSNRIEPSSSSSKKYLKLVFVSSPVIFLCMVVAAFFMQLYFYFEDMALIAYEEESSTFNNIVSYLPSIVYSVVIFISNASYRPLAHRLTDYENHRTETDHTKHLVLKILIFDSFNCFGALFYVAFWLSDLKRLRADLASLLIMNQILEQLQEIVMPYISTWRAKRRFSNSKKAKERIEKLNNQNVEIDEVKMKQAEIEAEMPPYEGTFDDFLELFLHFGYISLFSCVYPLASIWAFANNLLESRTDGFKFVSVHQRPWPLSSSNIGIWQLAFELMGVVAILTNISLIGMSADFKATVEGVFDQWQIFMLLIFVEHVLIFLKFVVAQVIPDWPEDVRNKVFKESYEVKKKLEQTKKLNKVKII